MRAHDGSATATNTAAAAAGLPADAAAAAANSTTTTAAARRLSSAAVSAGSDQQALRVNGSRHQHQGQDGNTRQRSPAPRVSSRENQSHDFLPPMPCNRATAACARLSIEIQ
ncbi:hypothetical protein [Aquabacter sp. CN5-332]|uniref:hypothetical protein n=1 Tax=Aquabacter sp. CN5-332 TaxID=3156608 RepID=UPI0032B5033C